MSFVVGAAGAVRGALAAVVAAALSACCPSGLSIAEIRTSSEYELITDDVSGSVLFDNCTETDLRRTVRIELYERHGIEPVDQTEVDADIPAETAGVAVEWRGLIPRQIGYHTVLVRVRDDEAQSGEFGVW